MAHSRLMVETVDGVLTARLGANHILDAAAIQEVNRDLLALIEQNAGAHIVLDFSEVRFLSSETLRLLLGLRSRIDRAGSKMVLCGLRPDLERIFKLTTLDKLFQFFPDAASARASFG